MTTEQYFQKVMDSYLGQRVDRGVITPAEKKSPYQCVDWDLEFCEKGWLQKPNRCVKAIDAFYVNKTKMGYSMVYDWYSYLVENNPHDPNQVPPIGAFVIHGGTADGHCTVCYDAIPGKPYYTAVEQNGGKGTGTGTGTDAIRKVNLFYTNPKSPVLGWLVLKDEYKPYGENLSDSVDNSKNPVDNSEDNTNQTQIVPILDQLPNLANSVDNSKNPVEKSFIGKAIENIDHAANDLTTINKTLFAGKRLLALLFQLILYIIGAILASIMGIDNIIN